MNRYADGIRAKVAPRRKEVRAGNEIGRRPEAATPAVILAHAAPLLKSSSPFNPTVVAAARIPRIPSRPMLIASKLFWGALSRPYRA
jgi:hypothetical protein